MHVAKWGNSLAVRLPKALVEKLNLRAGDELDIVAAAEGRLVVEKQERRLQALANMRSRQWEIPADYRFDRDEANSR